MTYKFHRKMKLYERFVDLFLCPSNYMKQQMIRGGFPEKNYACCRMELMRFLLSLILCINRRAGLSSARKYALFVGRLSEEKGLRRLFHLQKFCRTFISKLSVADPRWNSYRLGDKYTNLEFVGFRMGEELKELYRGATVVLLPSRVHEVFHSSRLKRCRLVNL